MNDLLTDSERKLLDEAAELTGRVFRTLERLTMEFVDSNNLGDEIQRNRVFELIRADGLSTKEKVEAVAEIMQAYLFLAQLDERRNEAMYLYENLERARRNQTVSVSGATHIRNDFYKMISSIFAADQMLAEIVAPKIHP